jgi:hypothetical protein
MHAEPPHRMTNEPKTSLLVLWDDDCMKHFWEQMIIDTSEII